MAEVRFEQVRKTFGNAVAVEGLDLAIRSGEFVSLLGPSGCGKTTTLRMLAGLEFPTGGTIRIGERIVNDVPPSQRDVAMVFQSYALYPHMTIAENIAYPLKKRRVPRSERDERVKRVAETLQLGALLHRKPRQLSGGQQQRVALGRALVRDPMVFLLDEPLSNLDAKLRAHMRAELIELHRRLGKTFVYVTHDQLEAMTMSDRVAVMHEGRLQQFATPHQVYAEPANLFVADFIGSPSMNLIGGTVALLQGRLQFKADDLTLPLASDVPAGQSIVVGIRPEDILLGHGPFEANVRVVEPTGHETIIMINVGALNLTARTAGDSAFKAGDRIPFDLRRERLHAFDKARTLRMPIRFAQPT